VSNTAKHGSVQHSEKKNNETQAGRLETNHQTKKKAQTEPRRMFYVARNACIHATERAGMRPHPSAAFCGARQQPLLTVKRNTNLMQHCAGFISAGSLYMFRA
jgi:hypothetical protein